MSSKIVGCNLGVYMLKVKITCYITLHVNIINQLSCRSPGQHSISLWNVVGDLLIWRASSHMHRIHKVIQLHQLLLYWFHSLPPASIHFFKSKKVNHMAPFKQSSVSWMWAILYASLIVNSFTFLRSIQNLGFPSLFLKRMIELSQGLHDGWILPILNIPFEYTWIIHSWCYLLIPIFKWLSTGLQINLMFHNRGLAKILVISCKQILKIP